MALISCLGLEHSIRIYVYLFLLVMLVIKIRKEIKGPLKYMNRKDCIMQNVLLLHNKEKIEFYENEIDKVIQEENRLMNTLKRAPLFWMMIAFSAAAFVYIAKYQ